VSLSRPLTLTRKTLTSPAAAMNGSTASGYGGLVGQRRGLPEAGEDFRW